MSTASNTHRPTGGDGRSMPVADIGSRARQGDPGSLSPNWSGAFRTWRWVCVVPPMGLPPRRGCRPGCLHPGIWRLASLREPSAFPGWLRRIVFKYCDRHTRRVKDCPPCLWRESRKLRPTSTIRARWTRLSAPSRSCHSPRRCLSTGTPTRDHHALLHRCTFPVGDRRLPRHHRGRRAQAAARRSQGPQGETARHGQRDTAQRRSLAR